MYETIFVVDSLLKSEEIDSIVTKYERFISANGGKIDATERWGKKRLAYEIKKRQYGYYVLIRFDGPPTMIKPLEREYRLNESLLRFKTLAMQQIALKHLESIKRDSAETPPVAATPAKEETPTEQESAPAEAAPEAVAEEPVAEEEPTVETETEAEETKDADDATPEEQATDAEEEKKEE